MTDAWKDYPLAPNSADRRLAAARTCLARVFNTSSVIRQIGPEMPSAPITSPVKLNTGTATQRTSELNSPSSMATALRRTSATSRNSMFSDDIARAILNTALEREVSFIVLGLTGKNVFARLLAGNVPVELIKNTRVPVVLLPPDWSGEI